MIRAHSKFSIEGEPHEFTSKRPKRHDCANDLPKFVPSGIQWDDRWVCPKCHRRWSVFDIAPQDGSLHMGMESSEGVTISGPDGSAYWRPYRMRFWGGWFL